MVAMQPGVGSFVLVGLVAALTTWLTVPLVNRLAVRVGAVAAPDDRRIHDRPTPALGGMAMLAGFLVAMLVAWGKGGFETIFAQRGPILGIMGAAVVMYAVGCIDDLIEISAPAKLAGIVLGGGVLSLAGVSIVYFRVPFAGFLVLSPDFSALFTVLWVIGMANATNFIDGLDGLAAGIMAIAAGAFYIYTVQLEGNDLLRVGNPSPLIAVLIVGVCLGFLPHNFHPAKVFMGDGGALLLGLLMAASTISVGGRTRDQFSGQTYFFFAPLFIPLLILGVPMVDTLFAILRRARSRSGVATADKGHLHHRLMNLGHGQRRSVVILWAWTALLSFVALFPTITGQGDGIVLLVLLVVALLLYTYFHPGLRRARSGGAPLEQHGGDRLAEDREVGEQ